MLFALKEIFDAANSSAFTVGCLRTLFYIKMQKVAKSNFKKLECTLDVLCHLYQTQMLLECLQHYYLLLFNFYIFLFNWFVFIKLYVFYLNVYLSLHLCSNKLEKFCLINALKLLFKWKKVFFYITCFIYLILGQFIDLFG